MVEIPLSVSSHLKKHNNCVRIFHSQLILRQAVQQMLSNDQVQNGISWAPKIQESLHVFRCSLFWLFAVLHGYLWIFHCLLSECQLNTLQGLFYSLILLYSEGPKLRELLTILTAVQSIRSYLFFNHCPYY